MLALSYWNTDDKNKGWAMSAIEENSRDSSERSRDGACSSSPLFKGDDWNTEAIWAPVAPAWLTQSTDKQRWLVEEMNQGKAILVPLALNCER